jgi:hypothetical protein
VDKRGNLQKQPEQQKSFSEAIPSGNRSSEKCLSRIPPTGRLTRQQGLLQVLNPRRLVTFAQPVVQDLWLNAAGGRDRVTILNPPETH